MDLVVQTVEVGGRAIVVERPADSEALLDEEQFERDEYMPYWAELWPSALALAEAVARAPLPARVLELGCGLGLPSIVAALGGAQVLATDWASDALMATAANARRNGVELATRLWRWDEPAAELGEPWPLVLAADVLYEPRNGPQLLSALDALVAPGGEAWVADPARPPSAAFLQAAAQAWVLDAIEHPGPPSVTIHRLSAR